MKRLECIVCNRLDGVERPLAGMLVAVCEVCWSSSVRRRRALEFMTGIAQPCDCGQDCGANRRARGAS